MNLLLIRGLGHSGTTILDLALGAHPAITGLGEAVRILQKPVAGEEQRGPAQLRGELRHDRCCTCGKIAAACPVWGPMLEWLPANDDNPLVNKIERLVETVEASTKSGQLQWLVDSYQADISVPILSWQGGEIRTVFLVRDVRSWVHSRSHKRERPAAAWRALARWVRENRKMEARLKLSGHPFFVLGYEELALAPEASLRRLCAWLDLPFDEAMCTPGVSSGSHILVGNRVRFESERAASIHYDGTWLGQASTGVGIVAQMPPVRTMNQRLVYGNRLI